MMAATATSSGAGSIFDALGVPFQYCLEGLNAAFSAVGPLNTVGAFGLAVMVTTLIIRGALFPVFGWQLRTSRRIQAEQRLVAPQLAELRKKYRKEPQKLSEEMKKLYAEHNVSPFSSLSGCLPALVQMPVLVGLYRGISNATEHITSASQRGFLWIHDVSQSAAAACCQTTVKGQTTTDWSQLLTHPAVLILPILAGAFTFAQSRMMMPPARPDMTDQERTMANTTRYMSVVFPLMIFVFSLNFPQGLAIYWVTGTLFMVLQQYHLVGWGSLNVPAWLPGAHRTTALSYPKHHGGATAKPATATASASAGLAPSSTAGTPNPSTRASKKRPNRRRR